MHTLQAKLQQAVRMLQALRFNVANKIIIVCDVDTVFARRHIT